MSQDKPDDLTEHDILDTIQTGRVFVSLVVIAVLLLAYALVR
jgi:hypothetical protein